MKKFRPRRSDATPRRRPKGSGAVPGAENKYGSVLEEEYGEAGCRICALVDPVTEERARKMLER